MVQLLAVLSMVVRQIYLYLRKIFKKIWIEEGQVNQNLLLKERSLIK